MDNSVLDYQVILSNVSGDLYLTTKLFKIKSSISMEESKKSDLFLLT